MPKKPKSERKIKGEIRILGFDDGAFEPRSGKLVPVIGVVYRGGSVLDGALTTSVTVDGLDATQNVVKLINSSRHKQQLKVIMFDGITLAGFNVVDISAVHDETKIPVIVINRKHPDLRRVRKALKHFEDGDERWKIIEKAGKIKNCYVGDKNKEQRKVYYQHVGLTDEQTRQIIKLSCTRGFIPEPLRVAHLLATAIVRGESYGRA
ncbi:MAG TPA: DUF99 family protein [archaeon]|nr:DUF99 family protein [archaeon]